MNKMFLFGFIVCSLVLGAEEQAIVQQTDSMDSSELIETDRSPSEPSSAPEPKPCPPPPPCQPPPPERKHCPKPCPERKRCPKPCPERKRCPKPCPERRPCPKPCPERKPCCAADPCYVPVPSCCPPRDPCCPEPAPSCYNVLCSAAPDSVNGWYIFGDLLYWHADVDHADWAFKNNNTSSALITGPNHELNFNWSFGFRVGLGANIDYDKWDTNIYYSWFKTRNSNSLKTSGVQFAEDLFGLASPFSKGKINWTIHYSILDWELGRWFYVSEQLALRPHIGLKGGWISQNVNEHFTRTNTHYHSKTRNRFGGVGAAGGINTTWNFYTLCSHYFGFFGDFAGAIMYGRFNVNHRENGAIGATSHTGFKPTKLNRNLMVPMVQAIFGLSWDSGFNCDRYHFGIRLGYEFQYWFRQNQMLIGETVSSGLVNYHRSAGDLGLQGLTLDFKFDF